MKALRGCPKDLGYISTKPRRLCLSGVLGGVVVVSSPGVVPLQLRRASVDLGCSLQVSLSHRESSGAVAGVSASAGCATFFSGCNCTGGSGTSVRKSQQTAFDALKLGTADHIFIVFRESGREGEC